MASITFITRHYPPNPNINGESVWDMVKYLHDKPQVSSNILCISRSFQGGGQVRDSLGRVTRIRTLYTGQNPIFRFFTFLYDGYVLGRKALQHKNTLIVCTTSPPLLPFWGTILFRNKIQWAIWFFDLFPEGFAATGMLSEKNAFYRWVLKKTYSKRPSFLIALGPKQAEYLQKKYKIEVPIMILPCGVFFYQEKSKVKPDWWRDDKIYLGYCGNADDPHNPDFIKAAMDHIDPEKHCLILALYGRHAGHLKDYAQNKPGIVVVSNVPRDQLHFIDVHLVTLRKEWTHIAVPSKAVSAVSLGSTILFCGSQESDSWYLLQNAGWFIDENKNIDLEVKSILNSLTREAIDLKKKQTVEIHTRLKDHVIETYNEVQARASSMQLS